MNNLVELFLKSTIIKTEIDVVINGHFYNYVCKCEEKVVGLGFKVKEDFSNFFLFSKDENHINQIDPNQLQTIKSILHTPLEDAFLFFIKDNSSEYIPSVLYDYPKSAAISNTDLLEKIENTSKEYLRIKDSEEKKRLIDETLGFPTGQKEGVRLILDWVENTLNTGEFDLTFIKYYITRQKDFVCLLNKDYIITAYKVKRSEDKYTMQNFLDVYDTPSGLKRFLDSLDRLEEIRKEELKKMLNY